MMNLLRLYVCGLVYSLLIVAIAASMIGLYGLVCWLLNYLRFTL